METNLTESIADKIEDAKMEALYRIFDNTSGVFHQSLKSDEGAALMEIIDAAPLEEIDDIVTLMVEAGTVIEEMGHTADYGLNHLVNPALLISAARSAATLAEDESQFGDKVRGIVTSGILPGYDPESGTNIILGDHQDQVEEAKDTISSVMREAFAEGGMSDSDLQYWRTIAVENWGDEYSQISKASDIPLAFGETDPLELDLASIDTALKGQYTLSEVSGGIMDVDGDDDDDSGDHRNDVSNWEPAEETPLSESHPIPHGVY
jgi:hypothetical protein